MSDINQKPYNAEKENDTESVLYALLGKDKDHVWAFCSGQYSQDFRGNPKYLFLYINKYRPDIYAYWLCDNPEVVELIRSMGYAAFYNGTSSAAVAIDHTGVFVAEQVKAEIPAGLYHSKYLNLWHGVGGVKAVERSIKDGLLVPELARKYIRHNEFYRTYEMYLAPSAFIEGIAKEQLGLTDRQIIHAGYPRDIYQSRYERVSTYEHDLIASRGLPADTHIAAYIPTRREFENKAFFSEAFPDMEKLIRLCEEKHLLFIFKMHPYYEKDVNFLAAKAKYSDCPWLVFWDNSNDMYEILDKIDLCIMDYSSMFTDMIVAGVKHYIRYAFDYDSEDLDFPMDYDKVTPGPKCKTFDELLEAIENYELVDLTESLSYINDLYWEYSTPDSMDRIIDQAIGFRPVKPDLPTLYSFDVFDTVISRKVLDPIGIFFKVRELMQADGSFPAALVNKYPDIHKNTELIIREYYKKSTDIRHSENLEISLDEILERISWVYGLTEEQTAKLRQWEIDAEIDNAIPLRKQINLIREYLGRGDKVILISDMYLPKEVIEKMLAKADPLLAELPLFLSNEYGVLKAHKSLYFEVYKSFEPFYDFKKWVHCGDNVAVDQNAARACGISTRRVYAPEFSQMQEELVKYTNSYDGYLVAALQSRICEQCNSETEKFIASYITLIMVPYIDWALRDAQRRGYQTLYFISRDGHPLKRIADAIIKERGIDIKTKYIYASRRTWRIPSFITEVDPCFWESYANFGDIISSDKLLKAMSLDEEKFREFFPDIDLDAIDFKDKTSVPALVEQFKVSAAYNQYLLDLAAEERPLVSGYLEQEIDRSEKFAIVEYWGRGYTQDTMVRLWHDITKDNCDLPFYYTRTVLPSAGSAVRYNFTTNSAAQFFIEGFFANMPYKSIERYEEVNGRIEPVIEPIPYNREIYGAMQRLLPLFAQEYAKLPLTSPEDTDHMLYDFTLNYYSENRDNPEFAEHIGSMVDAVAAYGKKRQFAPPLTMKTLERFAKKEITRGDSTLSTCITMSITRTEEDVKQKYMEMYQILPGDNIAMGRLLSNEEQELNRQAKAQVSAHKKRADAFSEMYKEKCDEISVTNSVIFVFNGKSSSEFNSLIERVKADTRCTCEVILLGKLAPKDDKDVAAKLAGARIIISGNPITLFTNVVFRPETEYIMLPFTAFNLYNAGLSQVHYLRWKQEQILQNNSNRFDQIMVPSEKETDTFMKRYTRYGETRSELTGNCATDCYFDPEFVKASKAKVDAVFPGKMNKKVILYMPTFRTRPNFPEWVSMFDMENLCRLICKDYVVLVNFNASQMKKGIKNVIEIPGFSKNVTNIPIRDLLAAADVVVGDYRDSFFETAMLHKPAFSTASDYEKVIMSGNMSENAPRFEQLLFCPIVETAEDLAAQLAKIDEYDYTKMDRFANDFFGYCDGESASRVVSYIKDRYVLTPEQEEENENWKLKCDTFTEAGETFAEIYRRVCSETEVERKVVFITERKNINNSGPGLISKKLPDGVAAEICCVDKRAFHDKAVMEDIALKLASAKIVITNDTVKLLCRTQFRSETSYLLVKDFPYPLAKRCHRKNYLSPWREVYELITERSSYTNIQVPAPGQVSAYTNIYLNGPVSEDSLLYGCYYTDLYFDESAINKAKTKLASVLGKKYAGKKTVLYMPTLGNIKERRELPIDLGKICEGLPEDYIIVLNLKANQKATLKKQLVLPDNCIEVVSQLSMMELIMSCDIIVGDYRNTFYDAALLSKPCFSTAFDADKVMEVSQGSITKKDIEDMQFCPVVSTAEQLCGYLENIDSYDYTSMDKFCEKMFGCCDGNSTDRAVEWIMETL